MIDFAGQCVSSRRSSSACALITFRKNSLTSFSVDDSVESATMARTEV